VAACIRHITCTGLFTLKVTRQGIHFKTYLGFLDAVGFVSIISCALCIHCQLILLYKPSCTSDPIAFNASIRRSLIEYSPYLRAWSSHQPVEEPLSQSGSEADCGSCKSVQIPQVAEAFCYGRSYGLVIHSLPPVRYPESRESGQIPCAPSQSV
jgi:hypothetical protein